MKNIFKSTLLAGLAVLAMASCTEEDNTVDNVFDGVSSGAVLRTISIADNSIPVGVEDATVTIELEYQDAEGGALLDRVELYSTFTDGSPDEGDSTGSTMDEVLLRTITADQFTDGPFGLPRYTLAITRAEFFSAAGLTDLESIFGGDTFTTRLVLYLTDGRVFDPSNAAGVITTGFFNSPFGYTTPVVCPVDADTFIGDYLVTQITPTIFGYDTFDPDGGGVVLSLESNETALDADGNSNGTLIEGADAESLTPTQRAFDADYIAVLDFDNTLTYIIDFVCGELVFLDGQPTGLACGGVSVLLSSATGGNGTYDFQDDTTFDLIFQDDQDDACGQGGPDVTIRFTKE